MEFLCPYDAWEPWQGHAVLSDGPQTVHVADESALDDLPRSGRVGFTAQPGPAEPVRVRKRDRNRR